MTIQVAYDSRLSILFDQKLETLTAVINSAMPAMANTMDKPKEI